MAKKKGEKYECEDCGLVVLVENSCECGDECQIMCCEKPMSQVKPSSKSTAKQPAKVSEKSSEKAKKS